MVDRDIKNGWNAFMNGISNRLLGEGLPEGVFRVEVKVS